MKKHGMAVLLALAVAAIALSGCSGNSSAASTSAAATQAKEEAEETKVAEEETTAQVAEEEIANEEAGEVRKVVVVTSGNGLPYSLIDDAGNWTGIDAEMWDEIGNRTGWEIEVKRAAFDAIWGELDTGRADVAANCFAVKPERTDKYNATVPYYGDGQVVFTNEDSPYYTLSDLEGQVIGATNAQAAQTIIEDTAEEYGYTVKLYEDTNIGMNDLKLGRVAAYAHTTTAVNEFMHNNEDAHFRFFEERLMANNVAYFLPKTEEGEALTQELNTILTEMIEDGTVGAITEKWMFADMTELIQ